ncbi:MAG: luciferase-like monooxygenase [Rhodospirillales bacterium]|jgi:FMNH2-dependent dimethyl sulfone monooxygenase|nr:luciferase-like monooxygenase [Rhodospirillales bacterium]
MNNANAFKIGLFGANCSSGRAVTLVTERWSASWTDNLDLAKLSDDAGIDFLLPIARWRGYGGHTDYQGSTLETVTWAAGLLAATKRITVFGTVHAPLFHPIIAAKEFVTVDHIGQGRFGVNLVVGWNEDEFDMFGVKQREHEDRYAYGQEWIDAIKMMWSDRADFDFDGKFIKLRSARSEPKPFGGSRPMLMNAGSSPVGRAFALRNCDAFFTNAPRDSLDVLTEHVKAVKSEARQYDRDIDVYTVGVVTCRPTSAQAEAYYRHCIIDNADWSAVDAILAKKKITPEAVGADEFERQRKHQANGMGGLPIVGDPDLVAQQLANLSTAGLRGVGLSFINYKDELPFFCAEVLPRLQRMGLRTAERSSLSR